MDENKDGKLSKEELVNTYSETMNEEQAVEEA